MLYSQKKSTQVILNIVCFILVSVIIIGVAWYHGFFLPFTNLSDDDSVYVGQALLFNAGKAQTYFDHTGYIYILVISKIFALLHKLRVIPVANMTALFHYKNFGYAFSRLVYAGRFISLFFAIGFVYTFYVGIQIISKQRILAFILSLVLASTTGVAIQSMIIRPELLSAYFGMLAFFLFTCAFQGESSRFLWLLFFASFFNFLALAVKLQAIIQFLFVPFLAIGFAFCTQNKKITLKAHSLLNHFLLLISLPFFIALFFNVVLSIHIHFYHLIVVGIFIVWLVLIRKIFDIRIGSLWTIILCLLAGSAFGFYCYYIHYAQNNITFLFAFFPHLVKFAPDSVHTGMIKTLFSGLEQAATTKIKPNYLLRYPINLAVWVLLSGVFCLLCQHKKIEAFYILMLLCICILTESLFHFRYYSAAYHIYIEYLYLIGAVFLCVKLNATGIKSMVVIGLIGFMIIFFSITSNIQQIQKNSFSGLDIYQPPKNFCGMQHYTPELEKFLGTKKHCREFIQKEYSQLYLSAQRAHF